MQFDEKKMTKRKIQHILGWASALKCKYVWTKTDQRIEDFLKKLK